MSVSDNLIASWAHDLFDLEDQIEALQEGKKDLYASIRDEHGKQTANALKRAVKLARMDSEKRDEADALDTEAFRILGIIEGAVRAPRATPAIASGVPVLPTIYDVRGILKDHAIEHEPGHGQPGETPASAGAATEEVEPSSDTSSVVPKLKMNPEFFEAPHPSCQRPSFCGGNSNLALCEDCKARAASTPMQRAA
jgi:uncharacterized protein (UPF0335 family)